MKTTRTVRIKNDSVYIILKRCLDFVLAIIALVMLFIPMLLLALLIKATSRGPVFFKQTRVGLNGKLFDLIKFRSMVVGANKMLEDLKEANEADGPHFKIEKDPRVTSIGYFIRKYGLDELPQLWNILEGHMSFVGPRPAIPSEVDQYQPWHMQRFNAQPGLTCFWQVSRIDNIDMPFDEWAESDIEYINNRNMLLDIILITKTLRVFIKGH